MREEPDSPVPTRHEELARQVIGGGPEDLRAAIADFVGRHLGESIAGWNFAHAGSASTHGLRLSSGKEIVLKVHPPELADRPRLEAAQQAQERLADEGFPCPRPLLDVRRLGHGLATIEEFLGGGRRADPDEASELRAIARGCHRIVELLRPFKSFEALDAERLGRYPLEPLWLGSHDPRVDFAASRRGAEWIDDIAYEARRRRYSTAIGSVVVGHNDWRIEHLRVESGELVAVYDWDSLVRTREPLLVASAIRGFNADWSDSIDPRVPSLDQVRSFLDEYEACRGRRFSAAERTVIYAGWIDALAYAARWEHGRHPGPPPPGGFQERLARDAPPLLGRCAAPAG